MGAQQQQQVTRGAFNRLSEQYICIKQPQSRDSSRTRPLEPGREQELQLPARCWSVGRRRDCFIGLFCTHPTTLRHTACTCRHSSDGANGSVPATSSGETADPGRPKKDYDGGGDDDDNDNHDDDDDYDDGSDLQEKEEGEVDEEEGVYELNDEELEVNATRSYAGVAIDGDDSGAGVVAGAGASSVRSCSAAASGWIVVVDTSSEHCYLRSFLARCQRLSISPVVCQHNQQEQGFSMQVIDSESGATLSYSHSELPVT